MRPHFSLTNQVLVLVVVPLVIQLGSLALLASLQSELERDLRQADRARRIADAVHALCADVYQTMAANSGEKHSRWQSTAQTIPDLKAKFETHYEILDAATRDNESEHAIVKSSQKASIETLKLLETIQDSLAREETDKERELRKPLWKAVRQKSTELLDDNLIALGNNQKLLANKSPEKLAEVRSQIHGTLFFAAMFNLIFIPIAALVWAQGFGAKMRMLNDNTFRLASDMPLNPVLDGRDELARLDSVFHKMADELKESARKERALVDNAKDLICSVDSAGRFVAVNPASRTLLGYEPEELLGSHLIDLIVPGDTNRTLCYLEDIKESGDQTSLELSLRRKDGSTADVLLAAQFERSENSVFCVVHDITARKQAERLRQEVVAMVTHDLRTPLGTVKNVLDFLEGGNFGTLDEKGIRYVTSGQRNVDRMMTLVNDLLDVEKISSGRMELELEVFNLNDCFESCKELHSANANELGIKLVAVPTDLIVKADHEKLQRVMSNLVSNAIKFSSENSQITMSAECAGNEILISVEDHGTGIPADQLDTVFERFQQVSGGAKKHIGSGLGLAICKAIAELHRGRIWVESETGKGSKFTLALKNDVKQT